MSFSSFFESLFTTAENAIAVVKPLATPIIAAAEAVAPVVGALVPSAGPIIAEVEAGAASISKIAPTAVQDAQAAIAAGRQAYTDLAPTLSGLVASLESLFHITPTPQGVLLTPKTTAATVPASTTVSAS